jgi:hypothetical protein
VRSAVAAAFAAVLALGAAGCGDERDEFRDDLRPLEQRAQERRAVIATELRSARLGSRSDARGLREDISALGQIHEEIAALNAPADYAEPFAAYVRANDRAVRDLERFTRELVTRDVRGLRVATRRVVRQLGVSQSARLRWLE